MARLKPMLLLDVDGVLNPFATARCPDGFREYGLFPAEEPVRLSVAHGEWLRSLAAGFDVVWATGWGEQANEFICPVLGLSTFPAIPMPEGRFHPAEKVPAVATFVGERSAAWVDDVMTPEAWSWAERRDAPTLLIEVDPGIGLTIAMVDRLRDWAAAVQ